jgi:hypothetical protein
MKSTGKFSFSFDNESFGDTFDSIEEALHDAKIQASFFDEPIKTVYIGEIWEFEPIVDADSVIERIQNDAEDEAGECVDDYLEDVRIADELKLQEMLTETFNKWAKETGNEPKFFTVKEVQEYSLDGDKDEID